MLAPDRFAAKLRELLELHNFALEGLLHAKALEFDPIFEMAMKAGVELRPMIGDVGYLKWSAAASEGGAQGAYRYPEDRRYRNRADFK